ncbi:MAG: hypothetical protein ACW97Z_04880 [Candidatus Hodarchaeales archaeon]|jgi:hypothetical protein
MTDIEIVDDAGDEFSVMNIPIPFYIRCKLNEGLSRYRVRILDETTHVRGFYTGASKRDFLEIHVPVIPLQNYGKLFIHIELDNDLVNNTITHETTIEYVDQETYETVTGKIKDETIQEQPSPPLIIQDTSHQLTSQEVRYLTLGEEDTPKDDLHEEPAKVPPLPSFETLSESFSEDTRQTNEKLETAIENQVQSPELSPDELNYLAQRTQILQEDISDISETRIKDISEIRTDEEE